jgi:hypothetical protein
MCQKAGRMLTQQVKEDSAAILCVGVCCKVDLLLPELSQELLHITDKLKWLQLQQLWSGNQNLEHRLASQERSGIHRLGEKR